MILYTVLDFQRKKLTRRKRKERKSVLFKMQILRYNKYVKTKKEKKEISICIYFWQTKLIRGLYRKRKNKENDIYF